MSRDVLWRMAVGLMLVAVISLGALAATEVKPLKEWKGSFGEAEEALISEAPVRGYIVSEARWQKLWKAWRKEEPLPEVDFKKQLILVGTTKGAANRIGGKFYVDEKGDLKGGFFATQMAGPGFAYVIYLIDRTDIKTYQGLLVNEENEVTPPPPMATPKRGTSSGGSRPGPDGGPGSS